MSKPLCVNCKHYRHAPNGWWEVFLMMTQPERQCVRHTSPIDGEPEIRLAVWERAEKGDCGPDGILWEQAA